MALEAAVHETNNLISALKAQCWWIAIHGDHAALATVHYQIEQAQVRLKNYDDARTCRMAQLRRRLIARQSRSPVQMSGPITLSSSPYTWLATPPTTF